MCGFCNMIKSENGSKFSKVPFCTYEDQTVVGIFCDGEEKLYYLHVHDEHYSDANTDEYIKIDYCPKCGRKLN